MPFYLGAIMAIVSAIILTVFIRETHPVEFKTKVIINPDQNPAIYRESISETNIETEREPESSPGRYMKGIIPTCIVGMLINMTQGAFFGFAPVLLDDLGYNLMGMFVFFIPGIMIFFAGSIASGIISDRVGRKPPVMIGLIIGIPAAILLNFLPKTFFIPVCLLMFIGISFTLPPLSALVLDLVSKEVRGNASGFYNTLTTLGNSGGVLIVGFVIQFYSIYALFGFSAILMSMCLAIGLFLMPQIKPQRKSKKNQISDINVASNPSIQRNDEFSEKLEGDSSPDIVSSQQDEQS
jgi:MFS family permease